MNLATLALSVFGLLAIYSLARRMRLRPADAAWVGAFVAAGPLYLSFQCSFMSDGYYTTFALAALTGYVTAIERSSIRWALVGGIGDLRLPHAADRDLPAGGTGASMALGVALRRDLLRDAIRLVVAGATPPAIAFGIYEVFPDWLGGRTVAQHLVTDPERLRARMHDVGKTLASLHLTLLYVVILLLPLFFAFALRSRERVVHALRHRVVFDVAAVLSVAAFIQRTLLGSSPPRVFDGSSFEVHGEFLHNYRTPLEFAQGTWWVLSVIASLAFPFVCVVLADSIGSALKCFREKSGAEQSQESGESALPLALLALCLAFHICLTSSFITFYNNYFLPLVVMAHVLLAAALRPKHPKPTAPAFFLLAVTAAASLIMIDSHFRFVEANQRALDKVIAAGVDPKDVFGYHTFYAWAHYDDVSDRIEKTKNCTRVFGYFRKQAHYQILESSKKPPGRGWQIIGTEEYGTLVGQKSLSVWTSIHAKS